MGATEKLSLAVIRQRHVPHEHYRFTQDGFQPLVQFMATVSLPYFLYITNGRCSIASVENEIVLQAGEFTYLPRGKYTYRVIGEQANAIVRVTRLPEQLIKSN